MVYNKGNKARINLTTEQYQKSIKQITCGEVSFSSKMIYLAGSSDKQAMIGAIKFDHTLKPLKFQMIHDHISEVNSLQRILGTDLLLAGCPGSLIILKLDKSISSFTVLQSYENLNCKRLTTQMFFEKYLYAFGFGNLLKFEYNRALDFKTFYNMEHCWINRKQNKSEKDDA